MKRIILLACILSALTISAQTQQDTINTPYWKNMMSDFNVNFYKTKRAYDLYFSNKAKERGTGWKQYERWADYWKNIIRKDGSFPPADRVEKAIKKFNSRTLSTRSTTGSWQSIGPFKEPSFGKWAGGNMTSAGTGRLNVLAIHPTNSDIMYAGAPQGGLWKTTNAGVSWTQVPGMANANGISAIALFANDANRIVVGTGDRDGGDAQGRGLYLSTDGGSSFTFTPVTGLASNGATFTINKIIVNPLNSNSLMATSSSAVLKSMDKGATWTFSRLNESFLDIAYCPNDTNTVYLTANKNDANSDSFYLSTDGGLNFNQSMTGITTMGINRSFVATTAANPNIVYLIRTNQAPMEGLYKSSNKGQTWTKVLDGNTFNLMGYEPNGSDVTKGQGFFDVAIYADNLDSNILTVGGVNLYQSSNGGTTWAAKTCWNGCNSLPVTHSDVHYITKNTNNNTYFICNDGGLHKTTDFTTFTPIYDGMVISQFYDIDVTAAESGKIVGGLQDNSMVERKNGNWITHIGGDGMFAEASDFDPNLMVGSSQNGGLELTKDGFASTPERISNGSDYGITEDGPWVTPFEISPFNDNILVGGFNTKAFYTKGLRNLAKNTTSSSTAFLGLGITGGGTAVRFSKLDSNICFIGTASGNLYYINNLANGGTPALIACTSPNAGIKINDIETSAKNAGTLWVAIDSMVYKSVDTGKTWTDITYNLPSIKKFSIVADKNTNFEDLYVGTESGVYILQSASPSNWQAFLSNLPNYTHIRDLEIWYDTACHSNSSLYAGTYGRGAWKSDLFRADDVNYTISGLTSMATNATGTYGVGFLNGLSTAKAKWNITPNSGFTYMSSTNDSSLNPQIKFTSPGVYTLRVKAHNNLGSFCTKSINVTVGTAPAISVKIKSSSSDNKICVGDSVILTASGGVSYTISPTENTVKLTDSTFKIKPTATKLYTITGSGLAGQSDKDSIRIIANAVIPVTVNPASATVVLGNEIILTASGCVSYSWSPQTYFSSTSSIASKSSIPTSNITYTVEGTDVHGCKSKATSAINVSSAPLTVSVSSMTANSVCKGSKLTLKGKGATSYTLNPMTNVVKINDSMFEVSPSMSTNYYLTGMTGSNSGTDSIAITVNPLPTISVNPGVKSITLGTSVTIVASGAATYQWSPSSFVSTPTNAASITCFPTQNQTYTVLGTNSSGCTNSANANILISQGNITVKMIKNTTSDTLCFGESMTITARRVLAANETPTSTAFSLSPMTNASQLNDSTWTVNPTTTTKYLIIGVDANNKTGMDSVNIEVHSLPSISVSPSEGYVQLGNTFTFNASGGTNYIWSPSTFVSSDTVSPSLTIIPTNFINYEVAVMGANGCEDYMDVPVGVYTMRSFSANDCNSYTWNETTYSMTGSYLDTFEASNGIDSIVTLNLTIQNVPIIGPITTVLTTSNPYVWRGKNYTASGTYKDTFSSKSTCDSIFELRLNLYIVPPPVIYSSPISICDSIVWRGKTFKNTGKYVDTVKNFFRDTIYELVLTVDKTNNSISFINGEFVSGCDSCLYQWYLCSGPVNPFLIPNATQKTFKPLIDGDYFVKVRKGICQDKSICVNKFTASILSTHEMKVIAYPNPVQNKLFISMEKIYSNLELELFDNNGKLISRITYHNTQNISLDMAPYAKGNYLMQINDGTKSNATIKITKE